VDFFAEESARSFLMKSRDTLESIIQQLDQTSGLSFKTDFAFATGANLMRGLKHPTTKAATVRVLMAFLEIFGKEHGSSNKVNSNLLGFLAPLLPFTEASELKELFWLAGLQESENLEEGMGEGGKKGAMASLIASTQTVPHPTHPIHASSSSISSLSLLASIPASASSSSSTSSPTKLFKKLAIPDETTATLLVSLMVTVLQNAEYETEYLFLYEFLAEAAIEVPEVFSLVYESLLPKLTSVIGASQNIHVIEAVQSILYTMVSVPAKSQNNNAKPIVQRMQLSYLTEIGFSGLIDCSSFAHVNATKKKTLATLASQMIQMILK